MLTIGGFATATQLSIKALRLYADLGILVPSHVDGDSGYRYYSAEQIEVARLIRLMRQMEMPLATIRQVLAATPAQAETLVRDYWRLREQRMDVSRRLVQELLANLREETTAMTLDIQVKTVDQQPIISIMRHVKIDGLSGHIKGSLQTLFAFAKSHNDAVAGPPFGIYHGPVNEDENGPMEVCLPVQTALTPGGEVTSREMAGGQFASVMLRGEQCDFPAILKGYDAVIDWVRQNGYEPAEAFREIWHSEPGEEDQMEVGMLFREKGA